MSPENAINAVSSGCLVECTKDEYSEIRKALHEYAGKQIDNGQGIYARIALDEVKRLDEQFDFGIGG